MYSIRYVPQASREVKALQANERAKILAEIGRHLATNPLPGKGKKKLLDLGPEGVICQLRVGEYRVLYDIDEQHKAVIVRHVRFKGRQTTGEIL